MLLSIFLCFQCSIDNNIDKVNYPQEEINDNNILNSSIFSDDIFIDDFTAIEELQYLADNRDDEIGLLLLFAASIGRSLYNISVGIEQQVLKYLLSSNLSKQEINLIHNRLYQCKQDITRINITLLSTIKELILMALYIKKNNKISISYLFRGILIAQKINDFVVALSNFAFKYCLYKDLEVLISKINNITSQTSKLIVLIADILIYLSKVREGLVFDLIN